MLIFLVKIQIVAVSTEAYHGSLSVDGFFLIQETLTDMSRGYMAIEFPVYYLLKLHFFLSSVFLVIVELFVYIHSNM